MKPICAILIGMLAHAAVSTAAYSQGSHPHNGGSSRWQLADQTDKMSGDTSFDAEAVLAADDGERFKLTAECNPGFVHFTIDDYAKGAKFALDHAQNGDEAYFLRTRLDDQDVSVAHSDADYTNSATIFFYDPVIAPKAISDGVSGAYGQTVPTNSSDANLAKGVGGFMGKFAGLFAPTVLQVAGAGTIKDLQAAGRLRIQVTMANGHAPIVTIALRDPALQSLFSRCERQSDAAYPAGTTTAAPQ